MRRFTVLGLRKNEEKSRCILYKSTDVDILLYIMYVIALIIL